MSAINLWIWAAFWSRSVPVATFAAPVVVVNDDVDDKEPDSVTNPPPTPPPPELGAALVAAP